MVNECTLFAVLFIKEKKGDAKCESTSTDGHIALGQTVAYVERDFH